MSSAAHNDHGGASHGSLKSYLTGFAIAVVLTVVPFWMVMDQVLDSFTVALIIMALAGVQMVVHLIFFLHMDAKSESGWNMMALLFTILIVSIVLIGSLWVMFHLNTNMMIPMDHDTMRIRP